jgi:hypothetical protein
MMMDFVHGIDNPAYVPANPRCNECYVNETHDDSNSSGTLPPLSKNVSSLIKGFAKGFLNANETEIEKCINDSVFNTLTVSEASQIIENSHEAVHNFNKK